MSLVITYTEKGDSLIRSLQNLDIVEVPLEEVIEKKKNLKQRDYSMEERNKFFPCYIENGFEVAKKQFLTPPFTERAIKYIVNKVLKIIKVR